ncbi:hypothetical protein ACH5Y9_10750 [Methylomonas sp. BW4-1]|uniref:hypothetical protein n=1 Tax=Methylomonas sp. BW4-1 TaxID=3376685 RepID=UPI004041FA22
MKPWIHRKHKAGLSRCVSEHTQQAMAFGRDGFGQPSGATLEIYLFAAYVRYRTDEALLLRISYL